jgi:hypothetical protein
MGVHGRFREIAVRREPSGGRDECPRSARVASERDHGRDLHPVDHSEEEGPSYFGFVKDTNGSTMPDAKVTVGIKDRGGVVTRTDALGAYKVPGFGKEVDPKDVEIACDKQGYKQIRILRRMRSPTADVKIPIETECTLQRI